jgi:hypothetical protein
MTRPDVALLDNLAQRLGVSTSVAVVILALVIVQLTLQIYALADLARRDVVRGDRKWVWVLAIAFGNSIGAIVYLVVGRTLPPVDVPGGASTAGGDAARRAMDSLYGPRDSR